MGTAESVARNAEAILSGSGHTVVLHERFDKKAIQDSDILLVCTSSTGMGDLPQNIIPFFQYILSPPIDMSNIRYGLISLGDSSYPNFAEAGKVIDEQLQTLGAQRLGEMLVMDDILVDDHEEESTPWISQWQALI